MNPFAKRGTLRLGACALLIGLLGACSALRTTTTPAPAFYALGSSAPAVAARPLPEDPAGKLPVLLVNPTHAASGFDSRRMIYARNPPQLEYFAHAEWVDTPARMLGPMIVAALAGSGAFRAVIATPATATGELRLDTELIRLQQDFGSGTSRVRLTLRATLVDSGTRQVVAWREFDTEIAAPSDDPRGGAIAAGQAVTTMLTNLGRFCAEATRPWRAAAAGMPGPGRP